MPHRCLVSLATVVFVGLVGLPLGGCSDAPSSEEDRVGAARDRRTPGDSSPDVSPGRRSADSRPSGVASSAQQPKYQLAPEFDLASVGEGTLKLSDLRGKVVLLDFWATWCGPCRAGIPHLNALYGENREEGFEIVGISVDRGGRGLSGIETVRKFLEKVRMDYPIVMADARTVSAYGGIRSIPTAFLIDREGRLRKRYVGLQHKSVFERDVKELLDESPDSESSI